MWPGKEVVPEEGDHLPSPTDRRATQAALTADQGPRVMFAELEDLRGITGRPQSSTLEYGHPHFLVSSQSSSNQQPGDATAYDGDIDVGHARISVAKVDEHRLGLSQFAFGCRPSSQR